MEDTDVESFSLRKEKPAEEEAEGRITDPRYLWGLSKRVEGCCRQKGTGFAEPETMEREQHLAGLNFRIIDELRLESF